MAEEESNTSVGPARSRSDTVTTIHSCAGFSEDDYFSVASTITMDDILATSDRLGFSGRSQRRLDPTLKSLQEIERASDLEVLGQCLDALRFSERTNESRFADASAGADTKLCAAPRRRLSLSCRSQYSSDLEYSKSISSNLDLLNASVGSNLLNACSDHQKSSSSDLDYRQSEQWDDSSFFLDGVDLDIDVSYNDETDTNENEKSESSNQDPLHQTPDVFDNRSIVTDKGEPELQKISHERTEPRRRYHCRSKKTFPAPNKERDIEYNRAAVSLQDLLDVFGDRCKSH